MHTVGIYQGVEKMSIEQTLIIMITAYGICLYMTYLFGVMKQRATQSHERIMRDIWR